MQSSSFAHIVVELYVSPKYFALAFLHRVPESFTDSTFTYLSNKGGLQRKACDWEAIGRISDSLFSVIEPL